ncbi:MAG: arabinose ABC transporter substrate-binding protein [Candidatus Hydrogenedentes bacterium]|nr:arabinose ABC transporter substrate-binding protein [Candidatus Hydrogenedentota bacterium]
MRVCGGSLWIAAALVLVSTVWGCGDGGQPNSSAAGDVPGGDRIRIGFLVKQPEEPWFQQEWKFAEKAGAKYGFDVIKIGATDGEKVLSAIDNLAAQGAQGFVICTPDVRLGPAIMAKANANQLKVFTVDDQFVGSDGAFMNVPYMGISARDIGESVGHTLGAEFKRRGWPIEETAAAGITFDELNTARDRTEGAIAGLIAEGFPADRIYTAPQRTTDTEGSFNAAGTLLTQHPEIKRWLVFGMNDEGVMGAVRAMEGRGFNTDTVVGVGIGGSTCLVEFEKATPSGFYATCLISPLRHGYETAELLYKWIKDGTVPPKDTRTKGFIITRENYKQVMTEQGLLDESGTL